MHKRRKTIQSFLVNRKCIGHQLRYFKLAHFLSFSSHFVTHSPCPRHKEIRVRAQCEERDDDTGGTGREGRSEPDEMLVRDS